MSEKNLTGQMNMFDYFSDNNEKATNVVLTPGKLGKRKSKIDKENLIDEKTGEKKPADKKSVTNKPVEMEQEIIAESQTAVMDEPKHMPISDVVMNRNITDSAGRIVKSISYINYNKVKIVTNYDEEKLYEFESAKEAVDFYVEKMQNLKKL